MGGLECEAEVFIFYHLGGEKLIIEGYGHRTTYLSDCFREIILEPNGLQLRNTNYKETSVKTI